MSAAPGDVAAVLPRDRDPRVRPPRRGRRSPPGRRPTGRWPAGWSRSRTTSPYEAPRGPAGPPHGGGCPRAAADAEVVARVRAAGGVVVGTTNTDELAMGASTETSDWGPTRNPHDPTRTAGGSSGGSAAAVAAYGVLALGTDTGGSIREPAAMCGVVGVAPSHGTVPTGRRGRLRAELRPGRPDRAHRGRGCAAPRGDVRPRRAGRGGRGRRARLAGGLDARRRRPDVRPPQLTRGAGAVRGGAAGAARPGRDRGAGVGAPLRRPARRVRDRHLRRGAAGARGARRPRAAGRGGGQPAAARPLARRHPGARRGAGGPRRDPGRRRRRRCGSARCWSARRCR